MENKSEVNHDNNNHHLFTVIISDELSIKKKNI